MDTAKAANLFATYPVDFLAFMNLSIGQAQAAHRYPHANSTSQVACSAALEIGYSRDNDRIGWAAKPHIHTGAGIGVGFHHAQFAFIDE